MSSVVIYATKYGSTKEIAEAIAKSLGAVRCSRAAEIKDLPEDNVVLGTPIYAGRFLPELSDFLQENYAVLKNKKLFFFIVCADKGTVRVSGQETGGVAFLHQINGFFEGQIALSRAFWGRMIKDELQAEDQEILEGFTNILGVEFPDFSRVELAEAEDFGREIKALIS